MLDTGRPVGTTLDAGFDGSTGRPVGTTRDAGSDASDGRPVRTTHSAGFNVRYCSNATSHTLENFCRVTSACRADLLLYINSP